MAGQPGRSGRPKGTPKQPQTGRQSWNHAIEEARGLAAKAHRELREEFSANQILHELMQYLNKLEDMVINGELPRRDLMDIYEQRQKTMAMLLPYLSPKMATTVVQHSIISEANIDQAREAVLKTMQRLRGGPPIIDADTATAAPRGKKSASTD